MVSHDAPAWSTERSPDCLDENDAVEFVAGRIAHARAGEIERHIDACEHCRWLLSAMARAGSTPIGEPSRAASTEPDDSASERAGRAGVQVLRPGTQLGRYTLGELRGAGAMGMVYAARDTELGRPVALKLLLFDGDGAVGLGRARLVREAQALARLSHPHVVAIYDVGIHDGKVFAAMELVDGAPLDDWLQAARRTPAEILEVMAGAGHGLAAAHAAGVIHRDVKPANILVGADRRARVTDFGLARIASPDGADGADGVGADGVGAARDAGATAADHLTHTGALLGTPAYMSPEQLCARPLGPETDQFSFAVTLHEALYGRRPFTGRNLAELRDRVLAGTLELPRDGAVPARVRRVLRRALAVEPQGRYPSMDALVAELAGDGPRRRRRTLLLAGAAGALALAAVAALGLAARRAGEPPCTGAVAALAGVWDPARRQAVERVFAAPATPLARDAFERVVRGLDAYTGAWVAMHTDACQATAVRGEQPAEVLALRMACLGTDRELTRQLVDVLAAPGFRGVSQAVAAVDALPRLTACADIAALRSVVPLPDDPGKRFRLAVLERRVAELKARWLLDEQSAVRRGAPELVTEAQRIGYPPITSDALMLAGQAETTLGDLKRAEDLLYQALWAAEAAHDSERVARAWITIMRMVGQDQRRFAEGERLLRNAEQAVERAAGVSPSIGNELRVRLLANGAALLFAEGKRKDAIARTVEALDLETRHNGPDTAVAAQLHHSLAVMKVTAGDPDGAWPEIQRALAIAGQRLGNGPLMAKFRGAAASILLAQGRLDDAIREFERTLAIDAQVFPDDNAEVAFQLATLADVYQAKRAYDRAEPLLQRAIAILTRTRGPESAEVSAALNLLGTNAASLGHLAEAQADFERALAISEKAEGPDHYHVSERLISLGTVLVDQGHEDRARPYLERGVAILEAQRAAGHGVYPAVLAGAQLQLARSLWASPRERSRARALASAARGLVDAGSRDPRVTAVAHEIDEWSAAHR